MFGFNRNFFVLLLFLTGMTCSGLLSAATSILNSSGGSTTSNGLKVYIDDSTQIQVQRLNSSGQLYQPDKTPPNTRLDNGIYIRGNGTIYGPDSFAYSAPGSYTNVSVSAVTPTTASQGVAQTTTSKFTVPYNNLPVGPQVSIVWSYTYPFDFVTANVTITIPATYPVSSSNPVRYYHVVDTYLGGSDCGCGVRYVDSNGKQVAGTYPLAGSCSSGSTSTNISCPSSTTLPANLDVVESFRERNGSFTRYCVGNWQTFWSNSNSDACGIGKSNQLSNTVNTTLTDTGAAIEYDFTAAGIYTFSYDFVVGSTAVPNYDHLEIRHAGTSSLCPFDVQVMACLSSSVPCPDDQMVSSGILYGDLLPANSSSLTKTPNQQFNLGSNGSVATFTLQSNTATTLTLGANNLTKAPLNGVKCWNTTTNSQSCTFVVTNTPCLNSFECLESGVSYTNLAGNSNARNPIYTKMVNQAFNLDVYALLTGGAQATGYVSNTNSVTVELVTESNNTCGTAIATKTISFTSADAGKKTVSFTNSDVPKAYPSLRCRVTDTSLGKVGCSTDNFSMRPVGFSVNSDPAQTNFNAKQTDPLSIPSPTVTPVFRASTESFNLKVSTGESGYNGTPKYDYKIVNGVATNQPLAAHQNAPAIGTITGIFPAATAGVSSANTFQYSEVGHFKFKALQIFDDTFTAVDSAKGDCDSSNNNAFNTDGGGVTPKKYGCNIGNQNQSDFFGRFIPAAFKIVPDTVTKACNSFVYYGQDSVASSTSGFIARFELQARNTTNDNDTSLTAITQNYTDNSDPQFDYAKFDLTNWGGYRFSSPTLTGGAVWGSSAVSPAVTGVWSNGKAAVVSRHSVSRPVTRIASQTISVTAQPQETDSTKTFASPVKEIASGVEYRYGRLTMTPAHGSELLPLSVPIEAQYWDGNLLAYKRNVDDSCTSIPLQTVVMKNYKLNLNACETVISGNTSIIGGKTNLRLSAPGVSGNTPNTGSVDVEVNLGAKAVPPAAIERTCSSAIESDAGSGDLSWFGNADPSARATFGVYKAPIIYMRENF